MNRRASIWLITGFSLVLIGAIIFGGAMTVAGWNFSKLSTEEYETNTYIVQENFTNISIVANTADISLVLSENEKTSVVCYENIKVKHNVSAKDGTLFVEFKDEQHWYDYIGFYSTTPKITVYLPKGEYGSLTVKSNTGDIDVEENFVFESMDITLSTGNVKSFASVSQAVKIRTSTGKIYLENLSAESLDLSASTGNITITNANCSGDVRISVTTGQSNITNLKCYNIISTGNTGDLYLENVMATGRFEIKRSTGKVIFEDCDAAEIFIKTSTGKVKGSLLSEKIFIIETNTGRVDVPKTLTGGRCEISTDTGNIFVEIKS